VGAREMHRHRKQALNSAFGQVGQPQDTQSRCLANVQIRGLATTPPSASSKSLSSSSSSSPSSTSTPTMSSPSSSSPS
jgi:hypothetical protein